MAAWPPVGGGRMVSYGKHHHPLGLSGGHAGCDVLSYGRVALETLGGEPRSLSEPLLKLAVVPSDGQGRGVRWSESRRASVPVHEGERVR